MNSELIKLAFALKEVREKEDAYLAADKAFQRIFEKLEAMEKKTNQFDKPGIIATIRFIFYAKKLSALLKEADELFAISGMKLKEWKLAIEEI